MRFQDAYRFLESLGASFQLSSLKNPKAAQFFLDRTERFLGCLGHPEKQVPHIVHITGTSGKGSVTLMLASILRSAGHRVGAMTSPAPDGLLGRIEINGAPLSPATFTRLVERCRAALRAHYQNAPARERPSFFELLTALGFLAFAEQKVDWAVVEVGLGGRFDPTNVLPRKDAAVITNIGFDHTNILGKTKKQIAWQKAGIIAPGCQVFTQEKTSAALAVIRRECQKKRATLIIVPRTVKKMRLSLSSMSFNIGRRTYQLPVLGKHQVQNALLARAVAKKLGVNETYIQRGLKNVALPARCEIISQKPLVILDGAHNPDKVAATVQLIKDLKKKKLFSGSLALLIGFTADKDIKTMLRELSRLKPAQVVISVFTKAHRTAAAPQTVARLTHALFGKNTDVLVAANLQQATQLAQQKLKTGDALLITGSLYLAGEIRPFLV